MAKYTPLFEAGQIGNSRASLGACLSVESNLIYADGYGLPPTAKRTEAYIYVNLLFWTISIGFTKRKELR